MRAAHHMSMLAQFYHSYSNTLLPETDVGKHWIKFTLCRREKSNFWKSIHKSRNQQQEIMSSLLKTPITILNELCMQEGTILYDDIPKVAGEDGMFSCKVEAFDLMAIGSDRSKKQAKHKACANLIGEL